MADENDKVTVESGEHKGFLVRVDEDTLKDPELFKEALSKVTELAHGVLSGGDSRAFINIEKAKLGPGLPKK